MKNSSVLIFFKWRSIECKKFMIGGMIALNDLSENEDFVTGIAVGINIYQQKVVMAYERKEFLEINGEPYFIQSGSEVLEQMIDKICT